MPGVCMASAVDAAMVDMQGTVFWTTLFGVHWTRQRFNPLRNHRPPLIRLKTSRRRNVDSMGQRPMPHMGCNSFGYIRYFTHCVNFLSTRSSSRTRCDAQETKIRGSVTNTWIRSPSNWNKRCIQFWRVGLRQEIGSRISNASSDEKETTYLFQRISVAIQIGNSISFSGSFEPCGNKWEPAPLRGF